MVIVRNSVLSAFLFFAAMSYSDAQIVFGKSGTVSPVSPCSNIIDNGCANAQPAVLGFTPGYQDTNFALDNATTGQLSPTYTPSDLAAYNAKLHATSLNIPYADYAIGSQNQFTLPVASSISSPISVDGGNGVCTYNAAGTGSLTSIWGATGNNPFPYWSCTLGGANQGAQTMTLPPEDLSEGGTNFTGISVNGTGTGTTVWTFILKNSYNLCTANCLLPPGSRGTPANTNGAMMVATGDRFNIEFDNVTIDGGNNILATTRQGGVYFIKDARGRLNFPTTFNYSLFKNFGGDIEQAPPTATGGNLTFNYSAAICTGIGGAHGEWAEEEGISSSRVDTYNGTVFTWCSVNNNGSPGLDLTAPAYISPGAPNGAIFTSAIYTNNVNIINSTNCTNSPPYSPANPCTGGTGGGMSWLSISDTAEIGSLTVTGNVSDNSAAGGCFRNAANTIATSGVSTVVSGGNTMNITFLSTGTTPNYTIAPQKWFYPGMWIEDTVSGDGFIPTQFAGGLSGSNGGTMSPWGTMQGTFSTASPPSGGGHTVFTSTGAQNIIVGQTIQGADSFGYSTGSAGTVDLIISSTQAELVGTFNSATPLPYVTLNLTPTCNPQGSSGNPGGNGGCGTLLMVNTSEPNITTNGSVWLSATAVDSVTQSNNFYFIGTGALQTPDFSTIGGFTNNNGRCN